MQQGSAPNALMTARTEASVASRTAARAVIAAYQDNVASVSTIAKKNAYAMTVPAGLKPAAKTETAANLANVPSALMLARMVASVMAVIVSLSKTVAWT